MYDLSDTVVAVSSPAGGLRSILRITGPQVLSICVQVFEPSPGCEIKNRLILSGSVRITDDLAVDARLYLFFAPYSYTGDDLAEIHLHASRAIVEALVQDLLARGLRPAGPGEFTARAYLHGKLDLAQAEAVNEIVTSSNQLQLEAAQRLLGGRLTQTADEIRSAMLDCLSLMEAGLDFSDQQIEFLDTEQAVGRLTEIQRRLEELLAGSIRCEDLLDLPAVGIAGAPNAGKSSLLNTLLGWERSLVSAQPKTTRDVLSGVLATERFQCVLFDCAGLIPTPDNILDELAQRAAIEALQTCLGVIFCVDSTKPDWNEDLAIHTLIRPKNVIYVATKCDLLSGEGLPRRMARLAGTFGAAFLPTSAKTGQGRPELLEAIAQSAIMSPRTPIRGRNHVTPDLDPGPQSAIAIVALTARHRQAVTEALESIGQAIVEVRRSQEEVAALMIRAAHQALSQMEQRHLDEQVLDRIFSRFCLGK